MVKVQILSKKKYLKEALQTCDILQSYKIINVSLLNNIENSVIIKDCPTKVEVKYLSKEIEFEKPIYLTKLAKSIYDFSAKVYNVKGLIIDCDKREIIYEGDKINLTDKETRLMECLVRCKDGHLSKEELLNEVWDYNQQIDTNTLETHIYRLRTKLASINSQLTISVKDNKYSILSN
jgi:two-component SAPR family response regulator